MNTLWARAPLPSVATGLALVLAGCAGPDPTTDRVPFGADCKALLKQESPALEARAAELLDTERNLVKAWADCDSGGYPEVGGHGIQASRPVIRQMQRLGAAEELRNTECLEYLAPSECNRIWRYTPNDSEETYIVLLPRNGAGEFAISVDRF